MAYRCGVTAPAHRYRSGDEDSARWTGFRFRPGDIVISTRSRTGTTWMQMICALLVFQRAELPAPLHDLSPWLDWVIEPRDLVVARLESQAHRRFIKTHTPLDGVPIGSTVDYIVMAREPVDAAVSLYHHSANLDRRRIAELTNGEATMPERPPLGRWLQNWVRWEGDPGERLDSLTGVMWHLSDAWQRRTRPNVHLVRYADLVADLAGEMRRLADRLRIVVPEDRWPDLVGAATLDRMRERADVVAPGPVGVLRDRRAFFRTGAVGGGAALLDAVTADLYERRLRELGGAELVDWLRARTP